MRKEYSQLIDAINSLPGVKIIEHLFKYQFNEIVAGWGKIYIFLHIDQSEQEGLFFLARCMDRRYWKYGHKWDIKVGVSDTPYENGDRPILYTISADVYNTTEEQVIEECESLIQNLQYHLNHNEFVSQFKINRDKYKEGRLFYTKKAWDRKEKIEDLGI